MNFDQILPTLYVGSYPATTEDIDRLKTTGITAVVNVQSDDDCYHLSIDWPNLQAYYEQVGLEVHRVKVQDFHDEELRARLPDVVAQIQHALEQGHTVYVHCSAGVNRSPSAVICYLHWIQGWSLEDAQQHVCSARMCDPVMSVVRQATADRD